MSIFILTETLFIPNEFSTNLRLPFPPAYNRQYSAETISIILVQFGMGVLALRNKMSLWTAFLVLMLFPLSVMFVAVLEYFGMD